MAMEITSGKLGGGQKVVIYGPEGIGKSTFASRFPNPLFIDTEGSTKHLDVRRLPIPTSFAMVLEEIAYVKANPNLCDTLVLDTADWGEKLCLESLCKEKQIKGIEDIGYGKGYTYLGEDFGRMLDRLSDLTELGIHVAVTAHAQMRKFEQPDEMGAYDRWELKLQKKTAPLLKEWADAVLFANYKTYVVNVDNQGAAKGKNKAQGGARVMYTAHHPCWDAKNRWGLKDEIPFDYREIAAFLPGKSQGKKEETPERAPREETAAVRYWHRGERRELYRSTTREEAEAFGRSAEFTEISLEEYRRLKSAYDEAPPAEPEEAGKAGAEAAKARKKEAASEEAGIPKALADLMKAEGVTAAEIRRVVGSKGYYTEDTPIANYDPNFTAGVLVAAWPQVFAMIRELREVEKQFGGK